MKAVIWTKYGGPDVLQLREFEKPEPAADEVRVRVRATTAFMGDCELRGLRFSTILALPIRIYVGFLRPKRIQILGQEFAGEIDAVGVNVTGYQPGDRVFGSTGLRLGTYAEYLCVPEKQRGLSGPMAMMPSTMSFEEAAPVNIGGLEALHFLRNGNIRKGDRVLIIGGGGSIGTYAIQLAKHFGARVTGVDRTEKLDTMRSIGADAVIDFTREDFKKSNETYDVIFDVVGKSHFSGSLGVLKENGRYLISNPSFSTRFRGRAGTRPGNKSVFLEPAVLRKEDLEFLKGLIDAGNLRSVIDRTYPLEQTAEAHRYVETGQKKGSVVISIA